MVIRVRLFFSSISGAAFLDQLSTGKTISEAFDYLKNDVDDSFFTTAIDYASQWKNLDYLKSEIDNYRNKPKDTRIITYTKDENKNIIYNDILGREELTRLYNLMNGDQWDDEIKTSWFSNMDITSWAGVSYDKNTYGINVQLLKKNTLNDKTKFPLPANLELEDFKRIHSIRLPEGNKVENLTVKNCTMLQSIIELHASNNLIISGCPLLQSVDLRGAKTVSISDCDNLAGLALDYAPDVETLSVKNCKKLSSIQCFCSKEHPSKLKHFNIENCDNLYGVTLNGCSDLFGTLDLADCKGLKSLSLTETGIREIKVGYLDELHVRETPIYQTYESIPDWTKHVNGVDPKFVYGSLPKCEDDDKPLDYGDGYKYAGVKDGFFIYYKQNYDDGHGFYHEKEPKDSKYWPEHKTMF